MALNVHLLPTNRSRCSDKSSDSGGVLDLSSRVAGDSKGEESWLFEMETKMKDMKLIEEEEIPDDLLNISSQEEIEIEGEEEDCICSDSLDNQELNDCPLLDINSSPPPDEKVVNLASIDIKDEPLVPVSSLEATSDPKTLLDDFGFNINLPNRHTDEEFPDSVVGDGERSEQEAEPQSLLDDSGFDIGSPASPEEVALKDKLLPLESPSNSERNNIDAQNLLDDFGFEPKLPKRKDEGESTQTVERLLHPTPSPKKPTGTRNFLDYFEFVNNTQSPSHTDKVSHSTQSTCTITSSQQDVGIVNEIGFDANLTEINSCTNEGLVSTENTSTPPSQQATSDANNILVDFGFETKLPAPDTTSKVPLHLQSSRTPSEQSTSTQNLLDDFGFDTQSLSNGIRKDTISTGTGNAPPFPYSSSEKSKNDAQSLLNDFGFDNTTTSVSITDSLLTPQPSCEQRGESHALLDDFGFNINLSQPSSAKEQTNQNRVTHKVELSSSSHCHSAPPTACNDCKPVKQVFSLIAFSDDVVLLWKSKEEKEQQIDPCLSSSSPHKEDGGEVETEKVDAVADVGDNTISAMENGEECGAQEVVNARERKKGSRLPKPNQQLTNCSSFLRSPVKCSQLEEMKELRNLTFDVSDLSSLSHSPPVSPPPEKDNGDVGVRSSSSDGMLGVVKSSGYLEEVTQLGNSSQSLNSSVSSEHSQASSVCSNFSTASKESRREQSGMGVVEPGIGTGPNRRVGGKIPKPASKACPSIKASLLSFKPATGLSKGPGAVSKMPPPNSRLMKPKTISSSASTSVKSGLVKPLGIKQTATHLPSVKNSKLSKMAPSGRSEPVKRQTTAQSVKLKNQMRSKLAVPSAGLKKKKTAVGVENPTTKKVPLTSSTPITCSNKIESSVEPVILSPSSSGGDGANATFTVSGTTTATAPSTTEDEPVTPRTSKRGRRSFIPTPSQENKVLQSKQIRGVPGTGLGAGVGGISGRVFKPRNGPKHSNGYGFVKSKGYSFNFGGVTDVPPSGVAKVLHSPMDKENRPATPHSKWSPVRRKKPLNFEEACIRCTKKVK